MRVSASNGPPHGDFPSAPSSEDSFVKHLLRPSWKTFDYGLLGYSQSCCALLPIADRELPLWGGHSRSLMGRASIIRTKSLAQRRTTFVAQCSFRRTIPDIQTSRREPWRAIFKNLVPGEERQVHCTRSRHTSNSAVLRSYGTKCRTNICRLPEEQPYPALLSAFFQSSPYD